MHRTVHVVEVHCTVHFQMDGEEDFKTARLFKREFEIRRLSVSIPMAYVCAA